MSAQRQKPADAPMRLFASRALYDGLVSGQSVSAPDAEAIQQTWRVVCVAPEAFAIPGDNQAWRWKARRFLYLYEGRRWRDIVQEGLLTVESRKPVGSEARALPAERRVR